MTMKLTLTAFAATCLLSGAAYAADDAAFLQDAIKGSIAEVKMGELAQQKSEHPGIDAFAQELITDHSAAAEQAASLAATAGTEVPSAPKEEAQKMYDHLSQLSGAEFDKAFVEHMIEGHQKEIATFEAQSKEGEGQVARFATATLPTLEKHLQHAESLAAQVK